MKSRPAVIVLAAGIGSRFGAASHKLTESLGHVSVLGSTLRGRDDFPEAVADALVTVAAADRAGYLLAVEDILESFEDRSEFLEDIPVADTVLVLQALAHERDAAVDLPDSDRLP
jgi:2-C-methyl-D-erythritol 4-phosphate cytidylyltransferase